MHDEDDIHMRELAHKYVCQTKHIVRSTAPSR